MNHRQVTHHFSGQVWVPGVEPPSGTSLSTRRHATENPDSRFLLELPSGDEHQPSDTNQFWLDFHVFDVLE